MSLEDKDSLLHGNSPMFRWSVCPAIEFGVVRLVLPQNVENGSEQHSSDGNDRFLVTPALFNRKIPTADFRVALFANRTKSTLNKQRLNVSTCPADTSGFLLSGAFVILRRKTSPRA